MNAAVPRVQPGPSGGVVSDYRTEPSMRELRRKWAEEGLASARDALRKAREALVQAEARVEIAQALIDDDQGVLLEFPCQRTVDTGELP